MTEATLRQEGMGMAEPTGELVVSVLRTEGSAPRLPPGHWARLGDSVIHWSRADDAAGLSRGLWHELGAEIGRASCRERVS